MSLPVESFGHYLSTMRMQAQSKDNVESNDAQIKVHTAITLHQAKNLNSPHFLNVSCENLVVQKDKIPKLMIFNILITHLLDNAWMF